MKTSRTENRKTIKEIAKAALYAFEIDKKKLAPHTTLRDMDADICSTFQFETDLEECFGTNFDKFNKMHARTSLADISMKDIYIFIQKNRTR